MSPAGERDGIARRLAEAGAIAGAVLGSHNAGQVRLKADGSPVCAADLAADRAAKAALARLLPGIPVISEESVEAVAPARRFILLDPLDGTREFLAGGDSYCVAIALIEEGRPSAGAIAAPALGRSWFAGAHAFSQSLDAAGQGLGEPVPIRVRPEPADGPVALLSRFHGDAASEAAIAALAPAQIVPASSAVKFGLIAEGTADLHLRGGQTMEWDIAAGEAILVAAGGVVLTLDGEIPAYGRSERQFRNPPFVAASSEALARRVLSARG